MKLSWTRPRKVVPQASSLKRWPFRREQEETEQTEAGLEFSTVIEANTNSPLDEPRKLQIKASLPSPGILCSLCFLMFNWPNGHWNWTIEHACRGA